MHTHIYKYRHKPTHRSCAHTHTDVLPHVLNHSFLFCLRAEAEPHRPWCHWWGHCLGHQQHSDGPPRAAGNYEVMDQHTLAPTHTHAHLIYLQLQLVPGSSYRALHQREQRQPEKTSHHVPAFWWSVRWKSTTGPNLDTPEPHRWWRLIFKRKWCPLRKVKKFPEAFAVYQLVYIRSS